MKRLRVGIVGCGEVTQLLHLPSLDFLADKFEVVAGCDVSEKTLNGVADLWQIDARYSDYRDLATDPNVDVVLIANPDTYHAEVALAAIRAGKHVLIEKPMCINLREAEEIIEAQKKANVVVQVGYMRRYAKAFTEALKALPELGPIQMARVSDMIGLNSYFSEEAGRVIRGNDIAEEVINSANVQRSRLFKEAIGEAPKDINEAYSLLLGLGSHDLSVMREMLGMPRRVLSATARQGGRYLTATFDYGDFVCHYETGVDEIPHFDAKVEIFGRKHILSVNYGTPYVRNWPITFKVASNENGALVERDIHPTREDPFVTEWKQLHASITEGRETKTPATDFRDDLELFGKMIANMRETVAAA